MKNQRVRCLFWLGAGLAGVLGPAQAFAQLAMPTTVYVFNQRSNDNFDNQAKARIWQHLGLLETNGKPGRIVGFDIKDSNNNIIGHVIREDPANAGSPIIGYKSKDGTKEAYDVNSKATTNFAWQRVAIRGRFEIIKHGFTFWDEDEGRQRDGGGITLDKGRAYPGFRGNDANGTGLPIPADPSDPNSEPLAPYPLKPRRDAKIKIYLNGCFTSSDPDGDANEFRSVTSTAKDDVNSVGTITGNEGTIYLTTNFTLKGTAGQQRAGMQKLLQKANATKFKNTKALVAIGTWISSLPFATRWETLQAALQGTGAKINLKYGESGNGVGAAGVQAFPTLIEPGLQDSIFYTYHDPSDVMSAGVMIEPGDLVMSTLVHLNHLPGVSAADPDGLFLASGIYDFRFNGFEPPLASTLDFYLDVDQDPSTITPYFLDSSLGWLGLSGFSFEGDTIIIQFDRLGVYAAFSTVPAPGAVTVLVIWACALTRRRRHAEAPAGPSSAPGGQRRELSNGTAAKRRTVVAWGAAPG